MLDTVLVAAEGVLHDSSTWHVVLSDVVPDAYVDVTLRPTYEGFAEHELRLYRGATPDQPVDGMFSFVPCLHASDGQQGFPRPAIRLSGLVNPELKMGSKRTVLGTAARTHELWSEVVAQVRDQGLALGTRLELPLRRDA